MNRRAPRCRQRRWSWRSTTGRPCWPWSATCCRASWPASVDEAVAHLEMAAAAQDALTYDEPEPWPWSVRETLGAVLLKAGRAAEAEKVFRTDLEKNPASGRTLFGLADEPDGARPHRRSRHRQARVRRGVEAGHEPAQRRRAVLSHDDDVNHRDTETRRRTRGIIPAGAPQVKAPCVLRVSVSLWLTVRHQTVSSPRRTVTAWPDRRTRSPVKLHAAARRRGPRPATRGSVVLPSRSAQYGASEQCADPVTGSSSMPYGAAK